MKKFLLSLCCLVYAFIVYAGPVSEKQALAKASQFMSGKSFVLSKTSENVKKGPSRSTPYYVFNAEGNAGFVIVSGDDRTKPILGYSENGAFKENELPENVQWWLGYYADVISSLENSSVEYASGTVTVRKKIVPMIQTRWDQGLPYNDQCVFNGTRCLVGCVATAMAQVINYYKYPNKVTALDGYTCSYTIPALPSTTLDWKNMCNNYDDYDDRTDAQMAAVATLMRYCGQSIYMNYEQGNSWAYYSYVPTAFVKCFGYNDSAKLIQRSDYTVGNWENIIYQELAESHPVFYSGQSANNINNGHAFVVDGYKDGLYHVNWGWSGSCDGYFVLTVMDSMGPDTPDWQFSQYQRALIGVRPLVGKVKLSKTKVTLETGKTLTLKATVSPEDLLDKSVTWTSSNKKVATVTSAGKVKAVSPGTATITCTSAVTGVKATCKVTVSYVELDKTEATILKGKTTTLRAIVYPSSLTDKSVTWESSNTKIATVTTAGKVKGVKTGTATITCTSNATGLKATCKVTVVNGIVTLNKTNACIQKDKTVTLKATVAPETLADKSVTWKSSDTKIATVTSAGKVTGVKYGTATITCTSVATGAKATCHVTVGKVVIGTSEVTIKKSRSVMLYATVYPTDLADKSVNWKSSDKSIATVDKEGRVKGIKAGTATITCTSVATGLKGTCTVTVLSNSEARSMIGDDDELTGLKELESSAAAEPFDVYDLSGRKVLHQVTSLDGLSDGIYIVNGKKILKKK